MKKAFLVLVAVFAISVGAFAQRSNVPYAGIGVATNFRSSEDGMTGPAITVGFRNYNRHAFISFAVGAELFGYYVPNRYGSSVGIFGVPEIGVTIGPDFFKVYPHTGFMLGYDSSGMSYFGWGGKEGVAFEIGRHVTIDFSTYVPKYDFHETLYAVNFIWRFY